MTNPDTLSPSASCKLRYQNQREMPKWMDERNRFTNHTTTTVLDAVTTLSACAAGLASLGRRETKLERLHPSTLRRRE